MIPAMGQWAAMTLHSMLAWMLPATPLVSAGTAIVALWISTSTARYTASEARMRAEREARAVAYAVLPSVVDILLTSRRLQIELDVVRKHAQLYGQAVAATVGALNLEMPAMVDRHLDRLGALPEEAARECLLFVNMLTAVNRGAQTTANSIGVSGPMEWLGAIELRRASLGQMSGQAEKTVNALMKVADLREDFAVPPEVTKP